MLMSRGLITYSRKSSKETLSGRTILRNRLFLLKTITYSTKEVIVIRLGIVVQVSRFTREEVALTESTASRGLIKE